MIFNKKVGRYHPSNKNKIEQRISRQRLSLVKMLSLVKIDRPFIHSVETTNKPFDTRI